MTEIETKSQRLVEVLGREGLDGVLLNGQHNFAWITGGSSNGVDLSRENGVASILVTNKGKRYLLSNNIEAPRMFAEEVSADDVELIEFRWQDEKAQGDLAIKTAANIAGGKIATDIPLHASAPVIDALIAPCRYELTVEELERFRVLGKDAGVAMRRAFDVVRPGQTELEIAAAIRAELGKYNITSVVTLVAADERIANFRHPVPTQKVWNKTLLIVTCAKRNGLIASLSRIACVGEIPNELTERTEAAAFVNATFLANTVPGANGSDLYAFAAEAYVTRGFGEEINKHHQGGAAGYRTRDWVAHPASVETVKLNQAFAWNPSINGTKVEETVIVLGSGVETITTSPDFPSITTVIDGKEFHSPGILNIH
jgi:antitoxin VapB